MAPDGAKTLLQGSSQGVDQNMRTICSTCNGTGWVNNEKAGQSKATGKSGSAPSQDVCPTCDGAQWVGDPTRS